jgi:hypothetical protein
MRHPSKSLIASMGVLLLLMAAWGLWTLFGSIPFIPSVPSTPVRNPTASSPAPAERPAPKRSQQGAPRPALRTPSPTPGQTSSTHRLPSTTSTPGKRPRGAIPGETVLSFYDAADREAFLKLARAKGIPVLGILEHSHAVRIGTDDPELLRQLLNEGPTPVDSSPNYYVRFPDPPKQAQAPPAEGYIGFGAYSLAWLGIRGDNRAWGDGAVVAVLDTGITPHPSLANTSVNQVNLLDTADTTGPYQSHGTAVASLIAGQSSQVTGVAPGADILSIQVMSGDGKGDTFTLAEGIVEAVNRGADVINICLGSEGDSSTLHAAVDYALASGVAVVSATGNNATPGLLYPARYEGVIAVSAVDAAGEHLYFANTGPETDIAAPGLAVNAATDNNEVAPFSGTSAAVPFVSGSLAWLLAANPGMTAEEAASILASCANDAGAPGPDEAYGAGTLDLQRVQNRNTPGIHDAAVGSAHLTPPSTPGADAQVSIYAQNRGTERLARVRLNVTIDNAPYEFLFYDIPVGATVSRGFPVSMALLANGRKVTVAYRVTTEGVPDAVPGNNSKTASVYLVAP